MSKPNRLSRESSPYLLQHQFNPVDWWPWSPEAFAEARRRDVPIFLSMGYSTCYWCHVMERESFENDAIAAQMNASFVCIKVDREERPDVDDVYMAAVQAFTHRGGWPMSVFLEPAGLKPFWAGTYFPDKPKFSGVPSFPQVLDGIATAWREQRDEVLKQAEALADAVRERVGGPQAPVRIGEAQVVDAVSALLRMHDHINGGFGPAPKFPQPVFLELLLAGRGAAGDADTRHAIDAALRLTLDKMALGGMNDQVGGGFHRYSVDERWLVPHFEKMLYDNAQLAAVYARAAAEYGDTFYARVANRTVEYVLREMQSETGGFFSAQDAEVNHREGLNYLWTRAQLIDALGEEDGAFAARLYGVAPDGQGNFRDPHHPEDAPSNVLSLGARPEKIAEALQIPEAVFLTRLDAINAKLLSARAKREQPARDDKVLAGWNGLMIGALSVVGRLLKREDALAAAKSAAEFVLKRMRDKRGELLRSFAKGRAHIPAFLEDYAFLAHGLVELHLTGVEPTGKYLQAAEEITAFARQHFGDQNPTSKQGSGTAGYFDTREDQADLFVRTRSIADGALPSANGIMLHTLIDLHLLTKGPAYLQEAVNGLASVSAFLAETPLGAAASTRALLRLLSIDRAAVETAFQAASNPAQEGRIAEGTTPVEILAEDDQVQVGENEPAAVTLLVRIAPGFHINAALLSEGDAPNPSGLIPFSIRVINGAGVNVYADYPPGKPFGEPDQEVLVYDGEFELPVVIEQSEATPWSGHPVLAVTYQACTDRACLKPTTVHLDLKIERK